MIPKESQCSETYDDIAGTSYAGKIRVTFPDRMKAQTLVRTPAECSGVHLYSSYLEVDHLADVSSYPSRVECGDRSEMNDGRDI